MRRGEKAASAHMKKMIAPIVITGLLGAYLLAYFIVVLRLPIGLFLKILLGAIPLALLGASVYMLIERIREIRSAEEDDIGQY